MSIPSIGGIGAGTTSAGLSGLTGMAGTDLTSLADMYRQQIMAGSSLGGTSATDGIGAALGLAPTGAAAQATAARGLEFGNLVSSSLSQLEGLDRTAQNKAVQAATGDLTDIQDYVIAATKAQTATELTTAVRNKALDSFNEIMRMSL